MPAGDIAVLDQKHLVVAVEHDAADPQSHAAGDPPIEMKYAPELWLQALSNLLQDRHGHLGQTDMTFDPCAGRALLPIHERLLG
jgi:hypothetical protein